MKEGERTIGIFPISLSNTLQCFQKFLTYYVNLNKYDSEFIELCLLRLMPSNKHMPVLLLNDCLLDAICDTSHKESSHAGREVCIFNTNVL